MTLEMYQYYVESDHFCIRTGSGVHAVSQIAFAYQDDFAFSPHCVLLKQGSPEVVQEWAEAARKTLVDYGAPAIACSIKTIVFPKDFDLEVINRCLSTTGYLDLVVDELNNNLTGAAS